MTAERKSPYIHGLSGAELTKRQRDFVLTSSAWAAHRLRPHGKAVMALRVPLPLT